MARGLANKTQNSEEEKHWPTAEKLNDHENSERKDLLHPICPTSHTNKHIRPKHMWSKSCRESWFDQYSVNCILCKQSRIKMKLNTSKYPGKLSFSEGDTSTVMFCINWEIWRAVTVTLVIRISRVSLIKIGLILDRSLPWFQVR